MRILINKNTINTIALPLSCNVTIKNNNIYFLFHFIKVENGYERIFTSPNISINKVRYDLFEITETNTEDLLNGMVSLEEGIYNFKVYQMDDETNLDLSNVIGDYILNGTALVQSNGENKIIYTGSTDNNIIYYKN